MGWDRETAHIPLLKRALTSSLPLLLDSSVKNRSCSSSVDGEHLTGSGYQNLGTFCPWARSIPRLVPKDVPKHFVRSFVIQTSRDDTRHTQKNDTIHFTSTPGYMMKMLLQQEDSTKVACRSKSSDTSPIREKIGITTIFSINYTHNFPPRPNPIMQPNTPVKALTNHTPHCKYPSANSDPIPHSTNPSNSTHHGDKSTAH